MIDVMLDLETLGTKPGSVILSIGAVVFDHDYLNAEFYVEINQASCHLSGLVTSQDTLEWWQKQSPESRAVFDRTSGTQGQGLDSALSSFTSWLHHTAPAKEICLWGNGSDFDNVLLKAAYDAVKLEFPTRFYNNRCFRTLKNLGLPVQEPQRRGVHHNALDDAIHQAIWAERILSNLRLSAGALAARKLSATPKVVAQETMQINFPPLVPVEDVTIAPVVKGDGN